MNFVHSMSMKCKLNKYEYKEGINCRDELFDGLKPGDSRTHGDNEVIGVLNDGTRFIRVITGYEMFRGMK